MKQISVKEKFSQKQAIRHLTYLAVLCSLVFVFQMLGSFIKFGPFSVSLVSVPIVLGACLLGPGAGAILGTVFGVAVLVSGDAAIFLEFHILGTIVTVLAKGAVAGFLSGVVFRLLQKKSSYLAALCASIVCPLANTGVFLLGCFAFFMGLINEWAQGTPVGRYIVLGLVGGNFLFELLISLLLSPAIYKLLTMKRRSE